MIEVRIRGSAELRQAAAQLRAEQKLLQKHMREAAKKATVPLEREVKASAARMPHRGGFAGVLSAGVRVAVRVSGDAAVHVRVYAPTTADQRDVRAIDRGVLRHPVYGRRRQVGKGLRQIANPWVAQRVRPGVVSDAVRRVGPRTMDAIEAELDALRQRLERG